MKEHPWLVDPAAWFLTGETYERPCHVCGKPTTKQWTPDPDVKGVPLCGDAVCAALLMDELDRELEKRRAKKAEDKE